MTPQKIKQENYPIFLPKARLSPTNLHSIVFLDGQLVHTVLQSCAMQVWLSNREGLNRGISSAQLGSKALQHWSLRS